MRADEIDLEEEFAASLTNDIDVVRCKTCHAKVDTPRGSDLKCVRCPHCLHMLGVRGKKERYRLIGGSQCLLS